MKRILVLALILLGAHTVVAQDWAKDALAKSSLKHDWAMLGSVKAFVAYPAGAQKKPVCVMVTGGQGLTDWAQYMADQIAGMGYVVVAPDLTGVSDVSGTLNAAADYGAKQPQASMVLMSVGFGKGATEAFQFATERNVAATMIFYGPAPQGADFSKIQGDLFGFYAAGDSTTNGTVADTQAKLKKAQVVMEDVTYENTKPGFMESGMSPQATPEEKKAVSYALDRMKIVMEMVALRGY
jgi:dienelactone hydrolase